MGSLPNVLSWKEVFPLHTKMSKAKNCHPERGLFIKSEAKDKKTKVKDLFVFMTIFRCASDPKRSFTSFFHIDRYAVDIPICRENPKIKSRAKRGVSLQARDEFFGFSRNLTILLFHDNPNF
jgi:hypothetical protein